MRREKEEEVMMMMTAVELRSQQQQQEISCPTSVEIENGVDFILSQFSEEPTIIFPRKISTYKSNNKQFLVRSKQEIINAFIESNFVDCKINAYPYLTDYKGIQRYKPNFIFIDIDKNNFKSDRSFKLVLSTTLKNIRERLDNNVQPTVLHTGGGYHIYQPISCPMVLENIQQFQKYEKPSQQFLRFAKDYLTNDKADKSNYPSFRSCLLRIPGSFNGKCLSKGETLENSRVKILQRWNGYRPLLVASEILYDFQTYLIQKKIDEQNYRQKMLKLRKYHNNYSHNSTYYYYNWIEERILANPFSDCRKIIVDLILAPYLINIKKNVL
jgi:hypothetical protein